MVPERPRGHQEGPRGSKTAPRRSQEGNQKSKKNYISSSRSPRKSQEALKMLQAGSKSPTLIVSVLEVHVRWNSLTPTWRLCRQATGHCTPPQYSHCARVRDSNVEGSCYHSVWTTTETSLPLGSKHTAQVQTLHNANAFRRKALAPN